jgi:uncharacterized protein YcnI
MKRTSSRIAGVVSGVVLVAAVPAMLLAHAVVFPRTSAPGAYERYVLRVPNEKAVATTRVELRFPAGMRIISFADVPGWQLETVVDSSKAIVAAVWTGTLQPKRFVEFPFMAVNPKQATSIAWPAFQTYADGERVEWTGAEDSKSPASRTVIQADSGRATGGASVVAWIALAVGVIACALAVRKPAAQS